MKYPSWLYSAVNACLGGRSNFGSMVLKASYYCGVPIPHVLHCNAVVRDLFPHLVNNFNIYYTILQLISKWQDI